MRTASRGCLIVGAICVCASAQAKTTTDDVIKLLAKGFNSVKDYKAQAVMNVDTPQLHVKDSKATIYFKRPNRVKIDAREGFALMPEEAVPGDPAKWIANNFNASYAGASSLQGRPTHVLKLMGRNVGVPPSMTLWVDRDRGLILAAESRNMQMTVKSKWTYKLIDGKYWLPTEIRMDMSGMIAPSVYDPHKARLEPAKSGTGSAVVTITGYEVNKGIPDSVFKKRR